MWINQLRYDGRILRGVLNDVPAEDVKVKRGDAVTIAPQELSDWMFLDHGKLVGGSTIRVLYQRFSPTEQKQFLRESHFRID